MVEIKGSFRVNRVSGSGSVRSVKKAGYLALFLSDRMLFVALGNLSAFSNYGVLIGMFALGMPLGEIAGLAGWVIGGGAGALAGLYVQDRFRGSQLKRITKDFSELTPDEIVKRDERNFQILYSDVSEVRFKKGDTFRNGYLKIEGNRNEYFETLGSKNSDESERAVKTFLWDKRVA